MAIEVPPIAAVTTLWQQRSVNAVNEYKMRVGQSGSKWQAGVDEATDDWLLGVNTAAANNAFGRGVQNKASVYTDKAVNLGGTRYGPGIQAATNSYTSGMGKVLQVIANVTLPPRQPTGSNLARVEAVTNPLHQAKITGQI